jgi:hypothetical protein
VDEDHASEGDQASGLSKYDVDVSGGTVGAIGDNAFINYGTVIKIYGAAPPSLSSLVRVKDFEATIRARTAEFVGRRYVIDEIDADLGDISFPSGYIIVEGEPGIGKTSLLSKLVSDRGYVHHLNSVGLGIRSNEEFLRNVCAQLIIRFKLDIPVPDRISRDAGFLSRLLTLAAEEPANLPLVIAVDALDEVQANNRLTLPPSLPSGVFFLITTRYGHRGEIQVDRSRYIDLRDDDHRNLMDLRSYVVIRFRSNRAVMNDRVTGWHVSTCQFIRIVTRRSEGNFMYLWRVLDDIESGALSGATLDDIKHLPQGLNAYYARHWDAMRSRDGSLFRRYQQPVISILASVLEPVSIPQLLGWLVRLWADVFGPRKRPDSTQVNDVVHGWAEFLNVEEAADGEPRYRIYHATLIDWIHAQIGDTVYDGLIRDYDGLISDTALAKIEGFAQVSPSGV